MILPIIGLLVGIGIGVFSPYMFPQSYSVYVAIGILACVDSVFGGIKSWLRNQFHVMVFISGFLGNSIIAMILVYFGIRMNIQLSIAAVVVFGSRIFQNFAEMRRFWLNNREKQDNIV